MKNLKIIIVLLFSLNVINAQQSFMKISVKGKTTRNAIKDVYIIDDIENNVLFAFFEEEKITYGLKYDENLKFESNLVSQGLKRKYKEIIGHSIKGNKLMLVQKNNRGNKYANILYDFDNNVTIEREYDIKMRGEKYIQAYSYNDLCYVFTLNTNSRKIKKWAFHIDGSYQVETLNLKEQFKNKGISTDPVSLLITEEGLKTYVDMVKIDNTLPNNLEIACEVNKMYEYDDGFVWTLDKENGYTVTVDFTIPDLSPKVSVLHAPKIENNSEVSNSFIFEDKIAQITSNNRALKIEIKSMNNTENIIKSYSVTKTDTIRFKNSPILQEGSTYSFGNTRKLEKTSKFLRKISSHRNGISIYNTNTGYRATIGGVRPQAAGGGMMMMPGFGAMPIAQFGNVTMSFNPAAFAYWGYDSTGSTRIESLFDKDFNHKEGEIEDNVFDKIAAYEDKLISNKAATVFKMRGKVIYGFYQPDVKTYELIEFE